MSMPATGLLKLLARHGLRLFTTADLLTLSGLAPSAATQALRRLAAQELITRVKRGLWMSRLITDINPYEAVSYLRAPWPAYVSLYSALSDYGVVEEVPHVIYAVSAGPPKRYRTSMGDFHFHHLPEHLIWGYEVKPLRQGSYCIAEPEKAFLDLVYLALTPRAPLELPHPRGKRWRLDRDKLRIYARRFKFPPLLAYLRSGGQTPLK